MGLLCISCLIEVGLHTQIESVILCEETRLSRKCLWNSINQNIPNTTKAKMCHLGGLRNDAKRKDVVTDDAYNAPMYYFHQCTYFFYPSLLLSENVSYG